VLRVSQQSTPTVDVLTASQTTPETRRALLVMIDGFQSYVVGCHLSR
jgi:hypothetical protein